MSSSETLNDSDSSSDEDREVDQSPLRVDWLDVSSYGFVGSLGITSLPGCRFKGTWRNLKRDIDSLEALDIHDVYVLCTKGELSKYRVSKYIKELTSRDSVSVHHYPFMDGQTPLLGALLKMLSEIKEDLMTENKVIIHCYGGLGRSSLVSVCLLLQMDAQLSVDAAVQKLKDLRGSSAIQSVKQFNFIHEFREKSADYASTTEAASYRSVSR